MSIYAELNCSLILQHEISKDKLAETAAKIAFHNFEWRYVTLVLFNSTILLGIDVFLQTYRKSVIISNLTLALGNETYGDRIRQFVVFGTDLMNIKNILDWMQERQFDNTGKFIFISEKCDETKAVEIFWNHKIINVVFIKSAHTVSGVVGFTYSLYDDEKCEISPPMLLWDSNYNETSLHVFPVKLVNFNLCQVIVSTFIQRPYMSLKTGKPRGADGDLLLLIGQALNATLKVMTPHRGDGWGMPGSDGIWTGSFGDIYYDLANFSMTSAALTLSRYHKFHMSINYNAISMVWVTHPAVPLPAWQKLLRPFQMKVRISLAVTFLFIVVVAMFVKSNYWIKYSEKFKIGRFRSIIFQSWVICMGMPALSTPSRPALLYIFFLWVFYCFMMRTFYQASLIYALKDSSNYPEFQNLDDILNSGYTLGGVATLKEYFQDEPKVFDKWSPINSTEIFPTMVQLSKGMKYVLAMNMDTTKSFLMDHRGDLHIIPQKIVNSPTVLFYRKFSPMAASLDRVLSRLIESGFTEKLYKNYASVTADAKKMEDTTPMNTGHYMGCYIVLTIGWTLSVLLFIIEIYTNKLTCVFN